MNFESPGALRRRIDAAQYADETADELSLGMARRAPSGVDSSMLSLADSSRDISAASKSMSRSLYAPPRNPSPPPVEAPARRHSPAPRPASASAQAKSADVFQSPKNAPATTQRRALTPTLAPTQDRQPSVSEQSDDTYDDRTPEAVAKAPVPSAALSRSTKLADPPVKSSAFSVAARRIRIANGTPPGAPKARQQANPQQSPSFDVSTPRATRENSAVPAELSSTPTRAPRDTPDAYAPSIASTTSSNDLLTPAAHHLRRGNTSLPGLVGPESVLRPRGGGANGTGTNRLASGTGTGAHVDVGKLAAYQHKINERLEQENGRLREDAERLTTQVEELEDEMELKEAELDRVLAANEELKRHIDQNGQAGERLEAENGQFRGQAEQLSSKVERLEKALERKEADLRRATTAKENLQKRLAEREQAEERLKRENAEVWSDAELLTAKVEELEAELEQERAEGGRKAANRQELDDELDARGAELDRIMAENKALHDEVRRTEDRLERARAENEELHQQLEQVEQELEEQRAAPPRQERSQTVRFDESLGQEEPAVAGTSRSVLRPPSVKSPGNKTFDLSLPTLANLSTMSWLNETTLGDQGMLAIIQQLQREVDERNVYVDDLMSKLDAYGKLLLQLGEKYELAQRKLASLAFVERDHDRMVVEREEIMGDVDRLESDMRAVRAEAASIGRELEALRSVKEARRAEESTIGLQVELITQLRKHHIDECKGLMLRIRYLKAKWTREAKFRSDLGFQKGFLHQLVGGLERDLAATRTVGGGNGGGGAAMAEDAGRSSWLLGRPLARVRTPGDRLRGAMLAVRAAVRMRLLSERWRQAAASKTVLADALVEARTRREERKASEGARPGGRASV